MKEKAIRDFLQIEDVGRYWCQYVPDITINDLLEYIQSGKLKCYLRINKYDDVKNLRIYADDGDLVSIPDYIEIGCIKCFQDEFTVRLSQFTPELYITKMDGNSEPITLPYYDVTYGQLDKICVSKQDREEFERENLEINVVSDSERQLIAERDTFKAIASILAASHEVLLVSDKKTMRNMKDCVEAIKEIAGLCDVSPHGLGNESRGALHETLKQARRYKYKA